jgi:uncharacterized protein YndB with AHSA1/START domain
MSAMEDGVLETLPDGRKVVRFERHLAHPIERVWAALTEPEELIGWWGDAAVELVEGGSFRLRWLNTDDAGDQLVMHATVTQLDPPHVLELTGEPHGVLRFELRRKADGTALTFTSTLVLPDEYRTKVLAGWHFHLDALADSLAGRPADLVDIMPAWERAHARYA